MTLITNWRARWWRLWSVWFGAFQAALIGFLTAFPSVAIDVVNALPPEWRGVFPPFVIFALFGLNVYLRIKRQPKQQELRNAAD